MVLYCVTVQKLHCYGIAACVIDRYTSVRLEKEHCIRFNKNNDSNNTILLRILHCLLTVLHKKNILAPFNFYFNYNKVVSTNSEENKETLIVVPQKNKNKF